ncbi:MAG: type sorting protein [Actinobacteria bacterium]|nr:type sorting protein [Actinomycetota bacterium]
MHKTLAHRYGGTCISLAALLALAALQLGALPPAGAATSWNGGDVFVAVGNGAYKVYDNSGNFKQTINDGLGGVTTGCTFNAAEDKLYTTDWSSNRVVVFDNADPHPILQTIATSSGRNESPVFAADKTFYVSHSLGGSIDHYDAAGSLIANLAHGVRTDWLDLAGDQKTMFFSDEVSHTIHRFDVSTNAALPDFATGLSGANTFALRLLPPGDGTGGLLVAVSADIKRLDGSGHVVQSYNAPGESGWFALNLDPNGTSFWSGSFTTNNFYRFNIATGAKELGPINVGSGGGQLLGICLKGERTAAIAQTTLTAGTATVSPLTLGVSGLSATLTSNGYGSAVSGQTITFTATDGTPLCSAVTDAAGTATCDAAPGLPTTLSVLLGGFNATFAGTPQYQASTAHGNIGLLPAAPPTPTATLTPTPTPPAPTPTPTLFGKALPVTGSDAIPWLSLAVLAFLCGIALLAGGAAWRRSRRDQS